MPRYNEERNQWHCDICHVSHSTAAHAARCEAFHVELNRRARQRAAAKKPYEGEVQEVDFND